DVQALWQVISKWPSFAGAGAQWNRLFSAGERLSIGDLEAQVIFSPGRAAVSTTSVVGAAALVVANIYMSGSRSAPAAMPNAGGLWKTIQMSAAHPDETRLTNGEDYQPGGREARWQSTVVEQKRSNPHLANNTEAEFVRLRQERDHRLPLPKLMLLAMQVNI